MQALTESEIDRVCGGDAAALHTPGQNAWGETVPGGRGFYMDTGAVATLYASASRQQELSMNTLSPFMGVSAIVSRGMADVAAAVQRRRYDIEQH